jgi:hypothetical protein
MLFHKTKDMSDRRLDGSDDALCIADVLGSTVVPFTWNWLVDKVEYDQDPVWEIELAFVVEVAGRIEAAE